jgi:hypothetical protein
MNEMKTHSEKQISLLEEGIKKLQKEKIELEKDNYSKQRNIISLQSKVFFKRSPYFYS